ncbi:hypothetical protein [Pontibacter ruber]|uniref:Uncharacterized protein n=1 Tax=Pontibacter ruber TaxID=1343895 RepID=A0ABW5D079_9BACT|nr:hypothetical protein [Pontibacter ruber]
MKYALVLQAEFHNPSFWVCYALANTLENLQRHICYDPSVQLMLHKEHYKGNPITEIQLPSCVSGSYASFIVMEVKAPIGLAMRYEL